MDIALLIILSIALYRMAVSFQIMPWKWVLRLVFTFLGSFIIFAVTILSLQTVPVPNDPIKVSELFAPYLPFILLYQMLLYFFYRSRMIRYVHALDQIDKANKKTPNPDSTKSDPNKEQKDLSYFR